PEISSDFTAGGLFSAPEGLILDAVTGVIDAASSIPGSYDITYTIEDDLANCLWGGITAVFVTINATPLIPALTNYELCDDNTDGFTAFDLTTKNDEILGGSSDILTHHLTLSDAQNGIDEITDLTTFTNQTINQQTIYVRVENEFGCYSTS